MLEKLGFILVKRQKNGVCAKVTLLTPAISLVYQYVKRTPKVEVVNELEQLLNQYSNHPNRVLSTYAKEQLDRLKVNKGIRYHDGNLDTLKNLLLSIEKVYETETETYIRDFSIRVFKDSKRFEQIAERCRNLIFEYDTFAERDFVLEELNIMKMPSYVAVKGTACVRLGNQCIDLSVLQGDIAFSSNTLKEITSVAVSGTRVITVENLTSFHTLPVNNELVIYLGGFHNTVRRKFIELIYNGNPDVEYYHFGDIDAGGFYIYEHLKMKTGVPFKRYHMDIATLEQHREYWKELTINDRKRLKELPVSDYEDVIRYMLLNNCKLEQEIVD